MELKYMQTKLDIIGIFLNAIAIDNQNEDENEFYDNNGNEIYKYHKSYFSFDYAIPRYIDTPMDKKTFYSLMKESIKLGFIKKEKTKKKYDEKIFTKQEIKFLSSKVNTYYYLSKEGYYFLNNYWLS